MGVCIPEMNLSVLSAGNKLLHGGMDVQAPQLICVTLERILLNTPHTNMLLCVCVCVRTCTIGVKVSGNVALRIAFFVVPMKSSPGLPSAKVRTGPNDSLTYTQKSSCQTISRCSSLGSETQRSTLSPPSRSAFCSRSPTEAPCGLSLLQRPTCRLSERRERKFRPRALQTPAD